MERKKGGQVAVREGRDPVPFRTGGPPIWLTVYNSGPVWAAALSIPDEYCFLFGEHVAVQDTGYGLPLRRIAHVYRLAFREPQDITIFRDQQLNGRQDELPAVREWSLREAKWTMLGLALNFQGDHPPYVPALPSP